MTIEEKWIIVALVMGQPIALWILFLTERWRK